MAAGEELKITYATVSGDLNKSQGYAIFGHASWYLHVLGKDAVPTYTLPSNVYILMLSPGVSCYSDADRMFHRAISSDKYLLTKNDINPYNQYEKSFKDFKEACVLYTPKSTLPDLTVTMNGEGLKMGINKAIPYKETSYVGYEMKEIIPSIKTTLGKKGSTMLLSEILTAIINEHKLTTNKPRQPIIIGCSLCTIIRMPEHAPANLRALGALGITQEEQLGVLTDIGITGYGVRNPSEEFQKGVDISDAFGPATVPTCNSSTPGCVVMGGGRKTYKTRKYKRTRRHKVTTPRKHRTTPRKLRR